MAHKYVAYEAVLWILIVFEQDVFHKYPSSWGMSLGPAFISKTRQTLLRG